MRGTTGRSAAAAVTAIPELLREILLYIDNKTLLLAQQVSHDFRNIITGDLSLKKKLFLAPCSYDEAVYLSYETDMICLRKGTKTFLVNKLLRPRNASSSAIMIRLNYIPARLRGPGGFTNVEGFESSWKRMYLTQPQTFEGSDLVVGPKRYPIPCLLDFHWSSPAAHGDVHKMTVASPEESLDRLIQIASAAAAAGKICIVEHASAALGRTWKDAMLECSHIMIHGTIMVCGDEQYDRELCDHEGHVNCDDPCAGRIAGTIAGPRWLYHECDPY